MTPHQIKLAANLWLHGHDTRTIAESIQALGDNASVREVVVARHIEQIKAEVVLMKSRAA